MARRVSVRKTMGGGHAPDYRPEVACVIRCDTCDAEAPPSPLEALTDEKGVELAERTAEAAGWTVAAGDDGEAVHLCPACGARQGAAATAPTEPAPAVEAKPPEEPRLSMTGKPTPAPGDGPLVPPSTPHSVWDPARNGWTMPAEAEAEPPWAQIIDLGKALARSLEMQADGGRETVADGAKGETAEGTPTGSNAPAPPPGDAQREERSDSRPTVAGGPPREIHPSRVLERIGLEDMAARAAEEATTKILADAGSCTSREGAEHERGTGGATPPAVYAPDPPPGERSHGRSSGGPPREIPIPRPFPFASIRRRALWSGSSAQRVLACPASAVLPRWGRESLPADTGSAVHDHMRDRVELGLDASLERLGEVLGSWRLPEREAGIARALCVGFEFTPPRGALAEVALCLCAGRVERIEGGRGDYLMPADGIFPQTIDVMWSEPEPLRREGDRVVCPPGSTLWVVEYKTGDTAHVTPVAGNAQVLAGAMLAARWTGAEEVVPAVVFIEPGPGLWDVLPYALGPEELDELEQDIRDGAARVDEQGRQLEAGRELELVEGPHCTFCPALAGCPTRTASLRALLGKPARELVAPFSGDEAARLAELLPQAKALLERAEGALRAHVEAFGPIPLAEGLVWGPEEHARDVLVPRRALPILVDELGDDAFGAVTLSREGVERAVKARLVGKRAAAPEVRRIMGRLAREQAIERRPETWWRAHRDDVEAAE
jgi:hypothetical protein